MWFSILMLVYQRVTWWNFWRLWGWKPWKGREIVQVRTGGCLCCECWTNLKSVHSAKSSSQATCQQVSIDQHRSTTNLIELADLIRWPCMGFSALTPLTLSSSMVSGDNIKNRLDVLWLSPATHGLKDLKCHRWVCAEVPQGPRSWSCVRSWWA